MQVVQIVMLNHVAAKDLFEMDYCQFVLFLRYIYIYIFKSPLRFMTGRAMEWFLDRSTIVRLLSVM